MSSMHMSHRRRLRPVSGMSYSSHTETRTLHLEVVCLRDVEKVVSFGNLEVMLASVLVNDSHV